MIRERDGTKAGGGEIRAKKGKIIFNLEVTLQLL